MRKILFITIALLFCAGTAAFEMEMGSVTVQDTFVTPAWTSVTFQQPFATTPLVFALPTNQGSDPATLRIRNVSTVGFEVLATEPSANDGLHVQMTTAYLAIE
ncbi:MAG: H-type lectin domain-containing protein, partial [Gammaproteobacteria bacterium]|nr:H-type lectin domain-containing protein [Gammaproteobacteria bacterium]